MFDISKPGIEVTGSPMGGGWAVPITDEGREALFDFFGEAPTPLPPLGGELGYIVEPHQSADIASHLYAVGVAWKVN